MKEKMGILIDSDLKRELEDFNFKNKRTEYKINYSEVCGEALKEKLKRMKTASQAPAGREASQDENLPQLPGQQEGSKGE